MFPRPAVSTTDVQCATIQRCGVSFFAVGIAQRPGSSILARLYPRCSGMGHPVADCPLFKHPTVHYFSIIRLFLCRGPPPPSPPQLRPKTGLPAACLFLKRGGSAILPRGFHFPPSEFPFLTPCSLNSPKGSLQLARVQPPVSPNPRQNKWAQRIVYLGLQLIGLHLFVY